MKLYYLTYGICVAFVNEHVYSIIFSITTQWLAVPFAMTHEATAPITTNSSEPWLGHLEPASIGEYTDFGLLLIFGGIPWQVSDCLVASLGRLVTA